MTPIEQELCNEISKAVEQIVAASHAAATKVLNQAFGRRDSVPVANRTSRQAAAGAQSARRSSEQIQELKDSVYRALCDKPGQTMISLAEHIGTLPRQLQVPIARLKTENLIKSAGPRHSMQYFPRNN